MRRARRIGTLIAAVLAITAFWAAPASATPTTGSIDFGGVTTCTVTPPTIANPGTTTLTSANTTFGPCSAFGSGANLSTGSLDVTLNGPGVDGTVGPTGASVSINVTLFGFTACTVTLDNSVTLTSVGGSPETWVGTAVIDNGGTADGTDNSGFGCPSPQPYNVNIAIGPGPPVPPTQAAGSIEIDGLTTCTLAPPAIPNPGTTALSDANTSLESCSGTNRKAEISSGSLDVTFNGPGVDGSAGPTGASVSFDVSVVGTPLCSVTLDNDFTLTEGPTGTWTGTAVIDNSGTQDGTDDSGQSCPRPQPYDVNLSITPGVAPTPPPPPPPPPAGGGSIEVGDLTTCELDRTTILNPGTTTLTNSNTDVGPCSGVNFAGMISNGSFDVTLNGSGSNGTVGPTGASVSFRVNVSGIPVCRVTLDQDVTLTEGPAGTWTGAAVIHNSGTEDGTDNGGTGCERPQPYEVKFAFTPSPPATGSVEIEGLTTCTAFPTDGIDNPGTSTLTSSNTILASCSGANDPTVRISAGSLDTTFNGSGANGAIGPTGASVSFTARNGGIPCTVTLDNDITLTEGPAGTWTGTAVINNNGTRDGTDDNLLCPRPQPYDVNISITPGSPATPPPPPPPPPVPANGIDIDGIVCPIVSPTLANPGTTTLTNGNTVFGPCSFGIGMSFLAGSLDVTFNGSGVDGTAGPNGTSVTIRTTIFGIPACDVTINNGITLVSQGGTPETWTGTAVIDNGGGQDGTDNSGFGCPTPQPYDTRFSFQP